MIFLIAEDNERMRKSIIRWIIDKIPGPQVFVEAADGSEAMMLYETYSPDWVLMDIKMEPMDGLTATERIITKHPSARIIMLTSYDDAGYRLSAQQKGAYSYVLKEHISSILSMISNDGVRHAERSVSE